MTKKQAKKYIRKFEKKASTSDRAWFCYCGTWGEQDRLATHKKKSVIKKLAKAVKLLKGEVYDLYWGESVVSLPDPGYENPLNAPYVEVTTRAWTLEFSLAM